MFFMSETPPPFQQGAIVVYEGTLFKVVFCWRDKFGFWQAEVVAPGDSFEKASGCLPVHLVRPLKDFMKQKTKEISYVG